VLPAASLPRRIVGSGYRVVRATLRTLLLLFVTFVLVPGTMGAVGLGIALFTPVPVHIPEPKKLPTILPSRVYDSRGNLIAEFKEFDSNIPVRRQDIPKVLKDAVIASEDRRFYKHRGVDLQGIARAIRVEANDEPGAQQGASTITMQLIKQVYLGERNDLRAPGLSLQERAWGKLKQAVMANRLDRTMDKDEILYQYLSNVFLGQGAYGVGAAAQTYFRKPVSQITLSEAATLVGIIPAPSAYEPRSNLQNAETKRKITLDQMLREGYISTFEHNQAVAARLWLESQGDPPAGTAVTLVYSRPKTDTQYPYFVDYVRRYIVARYGEETLYRGGLQIEATIDPDLQLKAEETAAATLKGTNTELELSIVSIEPGTGFVKALVGGRDFDAPGGQVNLALGNCPSLESLQRRLQHDPELAPACLKQNDVTGGGSGRSPGSSIKPIVLAAAFEEGISPRTVYSGSVYQPTGGGRPIRNYEGASYGAVDLRSATVSSVNTAYARLGIDVGIKNVAKTAQKLGITSAWYDPKVHGASYSLGGIDVSPLEMAAAYSVFANHGLRNPATPVIRVTDATGRTLEENPDSKRRVRVLSETVADNVTDVLEDVVTSGTGKRAALKDGRPVAGKTGTSQGYGNAWFVGYTPQLSTSVWVGYRDSPRPLRNIKGNRNVAGGTIPALTWSTFMNKAMEGLPVVEFSAPAPIQRVKVLSRAEILQRRARGGVDPGARRGVSTLENRTWVENDGRPDAQAPEPGVVVTFPAPTVPSDIAPSDIAPATVAPLAPAGPTPVPAGQPTGGIPSPADQPLPVPVDAPPG
jgi:membrane peptidoglycan carboxypeptidase